MMINSLLRKHFNLGGIYNAKEISDIDDNKKLLAAIKRTLLVLKYFFTRLNNYA